MESEEPIEIIDEDETEDGLEETIACEDLPLENGEPWISDEGLTCE